MTRYTGKLAPDDDGAPADIRDRVVMAAARLLREGGQPALTTRAITAIAGIQQPTLYRLFGDKTGLLDAVAEHALAAYVADKREVTPNPDPLADLREGWDRHVAFGLTNPALFAIIWGNPDSGRISPAARAGQDALQRKVLALAIKGLLRVSETRAVALLHATCTGVVLTLLDTPEGDRDLNLATYAREAVVATITHAAPITKQANPAGAAIALHASLNQATMLTPGEKHLMRELLDRIVEAAD